MINLVEMIDYEQHQSPCSHGNIVDGHACYCHSPDKDAPRKCPIWRNYGEFDLSQWHIKNCNLYVPNEEVSGE